MAENGFEVRYHTKFAKWLSKLKDETAIALVANRIWRIEEKGYFGDQEFFGGGVWEMRIGYGPGYRLYYTPQGVNVVMLLCGGDKSTQAADIKLAQKLAQEAQDG